MTQGYIVCYFSIYYRTMHALHCPPGDRTGYTMDKTVLDGTDTQTIQSRFRILKTSKGTSWKSVVVVVVVDVQKANLGCASGRLFGVGARGGR
jgi:hypothetical protein